MFAYKRHPTDSQKFVQKLVMLVRVNLTRYDFDEKFLASVFIIRFSFEVVENSNTTNVAAFNQLADGTHYIIIFNTRFT